LLVACKIFRPDILMPVLDCCRF